ncbi:UNVERIFIED_CONTAM: Photosystem I chlorophyll a apoprotein A1 [Sesamum calycinum]|uniref:Photosystem I chlorophyll a apoprotein A1 n=1 Tax=Sesamum calycinum TaxID=2727403 RepID=A0AAW2JUY9_9LAMI
MIIRSPEPEVKIFVDKDPVKTSFEQWAKPGHFSRTIAKGPDTTTWIWNLHADAHDFDGHTSDLEEISRKVFSAHFGQLSIIFLWLSGMYFHGARFSNYEAWLSDPTHIGPSAQIWRASGITSELQLYCTAIGALVFAALMLFAGWFHYHKAAPKLAWFQDVESMLNHHLAGLLGLGSLSWAGHQREQPIFTLNWSKYADFLTFRGGLDPDQLGHWSWPKRYLEAHKGPFTGQGHKGLYEILTTSWHAQLSLNLAMLGSLTIVVAHHMYSMPPYPYLATDYGTQLSLFTHHMWIGGFLIVGAAAHAAIFMVRDYDPTTRYNDLLDRVLRHRDAIISHLNWACIFLGFHSFAPGATAPGATASTSLTWGGGDLVAVGGKVALLPIPLGTADFLVHHIHAFTIHVTVLILLKGVLFARSSRLIPDKANLGFRFPCDGPGKGSDVWGSISDQGVVTHITGGNFAQSSITINGWLRDFLWAQASQDPLHVRPIAHAIWDPHFGKPAVEAFTRGGALGPVNIAYSGFISGGLFGVSSLAWTGHLVHVAIPGSRGEYVRWNNFLDVLPQGLGPLFTGQWNLYAQNPDSSSHLFGTSQGAGTAILTLLGGFHPQTQSLWLTDMAHHHLAIAFIFLVAGHMYRTNFGIGHSIKDLLDAHIPPGGRLG